MNLEDKIKKRQLELAAVYRREMEVLQARLDGHATALASLSDEELAREMGVPDKPRMNEAPPTWLSGPLRAAQEVAAQIRVLNHVRFVQLEEERS